MKREPYETGLDRRSDAWLIANLAAAAVVGIGMVLLALWVYIQGLG